MAWRSASSPLHRHSHADKSLYAFLQLSTIKRAILLSLFFTCFISFSSVAQFCQTWSLATTDIQTGNTGNATSGHDESIGSGMDPVSYGGGYQTFDRPNGVNWPATVNTANELYLAFPINPASGFNLTVTSITFSAYVNNSSGSLIATVYNQTTAVVPAATGTISGGSSGTPQNISISGLSIPVSNGNTDSIRLYFSGGNGRTLHIKNVVICGTSTSAFCANATMSPNITIGAGTIGNGTTNNILTNFSIGASANLTVTDFSFPFTAGGGLTSSDITNYKFYYTPTNTFTTPTLLSTVTTGLTTSPINFGSFSQAIASGSTGYFWVTADIPSGATSGHSITAGAISPSNVNFAGTPTTCGSVAAQGTRTIAVLSAPTVTTTAATSITSNTATTGGNVTSDGGSTVTERGLIFSTGPITDINSTTGGGKIINAVGGTGSFTTSLSGLLPNTTYHIRSYATNAIGTSYGADLTFTTPAAPARDCSGSGTYDGWPGKHGVFYLYAYVKAGEKIDWDVFRSDDGGSPGTWTINVYTPTGLYSTCTIGGTVGDQCTTAQITATLATEGIWTLRATPTSTSDGNIVCPRLNVYSAAGPEITGRVWTESVHGHDASSGVEPDFTLYFLTPAGYEYAATYSGLNGLYYTIVSDSLGVRTAAGSCVSAYQSVAYSGSGSLLGPDNANCGEKNKIFFSDFDAGLPASAVRFNIAAGSGQITEPLIHTPLNPTLSSPTFNRTSACTAAGSISFTVTNFTEEGYVYIDVNNNGIFTDAVDRVDTVTFVNGVNTVPFNGLDGLGNPIPISQALNVKVLINKIGETHFVMTDIEIFGGISVTRLNGLGSPSNQIFWNDSNLPTGGNCSSTPLVNGTGGVNSSGSSVHGWTQCGSCSPPSSTCSGTNANNGVNGSWGDSRLIDNWAYVSDSTLNHTIFVAPEVDTTYATVCNTALPYIWSGHSYSSAGTYTTTLTSSANCDSTVVLILTVNDCGVLCDASVIPNTSTPISVNGSIEAAWSLATYMPIQKATVGTISADFIGTQWKTLYDATNLYILVNVKDPNIFNDGGSWWDNDAIEIFIDGLNEKGTSYDGNDFQIGIGADGVKNAGTNGGAIIGAVTSGVVATVGVGYIVEVAIPWSSIGGTPSDGRMIGIDVQVDDDDNGGARETQVSWSTNNTNAFTNPSLFGQLPLSVCTPAPLSLIYDNTNPSCTGFTNGSIRATGTGGTAPYTYSLTGPGGPYTPNSTGYFTGLAAGSYVITVTDAVPNSVPSQTITLQSFVNPLIVTNDTSICLGASVQLSATGGANGYTWTPSTGLNFSNIANPIATPTSTTTYTVTSQSLSNLIVNPDFESGNVGFTSEYAHYTTQTTARQTYSVRDNPNDHDQFFTTCGDHTSGSGNMLVVDGSDATNGATYKFWEQTVPVNTGSTYTFSYWVQTVATGSAAQVVTKINGSTLGTASAPATTTCGNWQQVTYTWVATGTTANIAFYDNNITGIGNDFAIDDISITTPCPVSEAVTIIVDTVIRATIAISACPSELPYSWGGYSINTTGTYRDTLVSLRTGCDSIVTLNFTIKATSTTTTNVSVCPAALPYTWHSTLFNAPGTYYDTLVNSIGCDSVTILNLTTYPVPIVYVHGTDPSCLGVCDGTATADVVDGTDPYTYSWTNSSAITSTITGLCENTYKVTVTDANGCQSTSAEAIPAGCFQIKSILVDACSPTEYEQEMVFFQVGQTPLNYNTLTTTWPNVSNTWRGFCTDPAFITNVNATITGGGKLIAAPATLPAGAEVVLITSNVTTTSFNSFDNLTDTLYVLFQCSGNTAGHFVNYTAGPTPRTLTMDFGSGCSDAVTYRADSLVNINGTHVSANGAYVNFTSNGTASYENYGCVIPYTIQTDSVTLVAPLPDTPVFNIISPICQNSVPPVLPTSSLNIPPITGTWNAAVSTATPGTTIYTFTPTVGQCAVPTTASITVKPISTNSTSVTICSSVLPYLWNSNSYSSGGTYLDTLVNSVGCDSILTLVLTVTTLPTASISYATPYCSNAGTGTVSLTGTTGGIYTSTAGLTINASTGAVDLAASTAGTYTVTYTIAAANSCPVVTATTSITITALPVATISYASPYCSNAGTATVTLTGTTGGTYSSTAGLSINASTGAVNLAASTAGTYTVTYTISAANGCPPVTATTSITITALPVATISYATPYCSNGGTATVTLTGTTGGTYSSTAGLSINASTGAVNLAASTAGTYTITYTIAAANGCPPVTATTSITITALPVATIAYASPFCSNGGSATVTLTGTTGGTYSSTAGLSINASTGAI
ncbi:MAG: sugar-binding protein, partial [Bacteroidota bacterium]